MQRRRVQALTTSSVAAVAAVFLLGACLTPSAPDEQPQTTATAVQPDYPRLESGEYVLVYRDAQFRTAPDDTAEAFRAFEPDRLRAEAIGESRIAARVVADHGEFVEIQRPELRGDAPDFCDNARLNSKLYRVVLRYFVAREDLAPTVRRRVEYGYDDDTGVELAAGLPVEPHPQQSDRFRTGDERFTFTVDDHADVGRLGFSPDGLSEQEHRYMHLDVDADADFRVGERTVRVDVDEEKIRVPRIEQRGFERLVRLQGACFRVSASIHADDASSPISPPPAGGEGYGRAGLATDLVAEPGTEVYWPDGRPAGEIVEQKYFNPADADDDNRICETTPLVGERAEFCEDGRAAEQRRTVEYCVRVEDFEQREDND